MTEHRPEQSAPAASPLSRCPECGTFVVSSEPGPVRPWSIGVWIPILCMLGFAAWLFYPSAMKSAWWNYDYAIDVHSHVPMMESGGVSMKRLHELAADDAPPSDRLVRDLIREASRLPAGVGEDRVLMAQVNRVAGRRCVSSRLGWPLTLILTCQDAQHFDSVLRAPTPPPTLVAEGGYEPSEHWNWSFANVYASLPSGISSNTLNVMWTGAAAWAIAGWLVVQFVGWTALRRGRNRTRARITCAALLVGLFGAVTLLSWERSVSASVNAHPSINGSRVLAVPRESDLRALTDHANGDRVLARALLESLAQPAEDISEARLVIALAAQHVSHVECGTIKGRPWELASYRRIARSEWPVPRPQTASPASALVPPSVPSGPYVAYDAAPARLQVRGQDLVFTLPTREGAMHVRSLSLNFGLVSLYIATLYLAWCVPRWVIARGRLVRARRRQRRGLCAACGYQLSA